MQGTKRIVRWLVLTGCLTMNMYANSAWAALPDPVTFSWAIESNNVRKVQAWFDEGLNPEFEGKTLGSGLCIAAWYGNIPLMQMFLERGANINRANANGEQPLQLAAWNGHAEAVQWLLAHGATLNRNGKGWSALHYAVFNGHNDLAKSLIERGAEVNARSPNGATPLMIAARENREELIKVLLESGADPRLKTDWGDTALVMAMRYDHLKAGQMIASPEEFAIAVKAPKESFGEPARSTSAPSEIEVLLGKIRAAEAAGEPTEALRKQLVDVAHEMQRKAWQTKMALRNNKVLEPPRPRTIIVTAKRNEPGAERVQVVTDAKATPPATQAAGKPSISIRSTNDQKAVQAQIAETMRQIRLAEAQGQPTDALRAQLAQLTSQLQ